MRLTTRSRTTKVRARPTTKSTNMNSKDIFNIVVELSKMQETELVKHNKSLAERLSKNDKPSPFNLSKSKQ